MPFIQFHVVEGRSDQELAALLDAAHRVVLDTLHVPVRDRYQIVHEHKPSRIRAEDTGLGIEAVRQFRAAAHHHPASHCRGEDHFLYRKLCAELERSCTASRRLT